MPEMSRPRAAGLQGSNGRTGPAILSLGSINADFQVRVDRWPDAGETLLARDFVVLAGGKAAAAGAGRIFPARAFE